MRKYLTLALVLALAAIIVAACTPAPTTPAPVCIPPSTLPGYASPTWEELKDGTSKKFDISEVGVTFEFIRKGDNIRLNTYASGKLLPTNVTGQMPDKLPQGLISATLDTDITTRKWVVFLWTCSDKIWITGYFFP